MNARHSESRSALEEWTLEQYGDLLTHILSSSIPLVGLDEFARGASGVWLRHDVEIDLAAATRMAKCEAALGVRASYFLCAESPFIDSGSDEIRDCATDLLGMGHQVSLHVFLGADKGPVMDRIDDIVQDLALPHPEAVTFHAPGLAAEVLAQAPLGEMVYGPLAAQACQYFSDSTGRWRWGHPRGAVAQGGSTQLLTHPFWWVGDRLRVAQLCQRSIVHGAFLPQLWAELLERGGRLDSGEAAPSCRDAELLPKDVGEGLHQSAGGGPRVGNTRNQHRGQ
jgi:hypothetical protein